MSVIDYYGKGRQDAAEGKDSLEFGIELQFQQPYWGDYMRGQVDYIKERSKEVLAVSGIEDFKIQLKNLCANYHVSYHEECPEREGYTFYYNSPNFGCIPIRLP